MATTYFTNVRREQDKVTRFIRRWVDPKSDQLEFATVMARLINRPETLEFIGFPGSDVAWGDIEKRILEADKRIRPFWGSAYVVSTHGQRMSKLDYLLGVLYAARSALPLVWVAGVQPTCAAAYSAFKRLEGFGSFMAAQVVADLKNTPTHPLYHAPDWKTFVAPGPGSKKGMNYFMGFLPSSPISEKRFMQNIEVVRRLTEKRVPLVREICNQDLQNCLCEYSKFMRIISGTGRSKRKYDAHQRI